MRLLVGGLYHETNTFASNKTDINDFEFLDKGSLIPKMENTKTEIGGFITRAAERKIELIPTFHAKCIPSGIVSKKAIEYVFSNILKEIKSASNFDGVLLRLHGAMVGEGCDDPEGVLIQKIRDIVGNKPIVSTLDLHANISKLMVESVDVLTGYNTYPHEDCYERGFEAVDIISEIITGEIQPTTSFLKPPLMPPAQGLYTSKEPMKSLIDKAAELERTPGVVTVTVSGGFCYSDVPFAGMSVLATTNKNKELAKRVAADLYYLAMDNHESFLVEQKEVVEGVLKADKCKEGPVIIVDAADNIGGGSPGDGTTVLKALKEHNVGPSVVCLSDPESVDLAIKAGIGQQVNLSVGGKVDDMHGSPVEIEGTVSIISTGDFQYKGTYMTGEKVERGITVVIKSELQTIVLSKKKVMPFDQEELRSLGIDPMDYKIIVVKSAIAWRAAYGSIAKKVIEVDTPGICAANLSRFDFKKVRRPIFPLDEVCN